MFYAKTGRISDPSIQRNIDQLAKALLICWLILMAIALSRKGWDFEGMFFPYLEGYKLNPWARGRVGGGISALLSLGRLFADFADGSIWCGGSACKESQDKNDGDHGLFFGLSLLHL